MNQGLYTDSAEVQTAVLYATVFRRRTWMISPYVRRLRLAYELQALRSESGYTHQQLAKKIGQSRAQISRLENAHASPDQDDIIKILDVLGIDGQRWTQLVKIAREAAERGWWESNSHAMGTRTAKYANLEAGATTIREYQLTFPPGLLQTPDFSRARVEAEKEVRSLEAAPDKVVAAREGRQRMLRRPDGPTYELILDELAIRRLSVPPEVMKAQLYHIAAAINGEAKVDVYVLPIDVQIDGYSVPRTAWSIYTYPDPGDPTVVAVDTIGQDLVLDDLYNPEKVTPYEELYRRLRRAALSSDDSLELLIKTAATLSGNK